MKRAILCLILITVSASAKNAGEDYLGLTLPAIANGIMLVSYHQIGPGARGMEIMGADQECRDRFEMVMRVRDTANSWTICSPKR